MKTVSWEPSCCMRIDGQTGMKLLVAFCNFANSPKIVKLLSIFLQFFEGTWEGCANALGVFALSRGVAC
jgi:hypothetical protein